MSSFEDKLAVVTGKQAPRSSPAPAGKSGNDSARVDEPSRAGRAPYNFVPLAAKARWLDAAEVPPRQDVATAGLLSGTIDVEIRALTRFYLRGMLTLAEYVNSAGQAKKPQNAAPFAVHGRLRLPGSSLRGMVRQLVEIMGETPLDLLNDSQLFFRTVGSTSNPGDRNSFEPHSKPYKDRIDWQRGTVKVGFIEAHRDDDQWTIRPAQVKEGRQCYKYALAPKFQDIFRDKSKQWKPARKVWFRPAGNLGRAEVAETPQAGYEEGWLLYTGAIPKKRHQWVLRLANEKADAVKIPEADVIAYREAGISQTISNQKFEFSKDKPGAPCFYVEWTGPDQVKHVSFGHTYNFRLPYQHTVGQAVPAANQRHGQAQKWDLAQAIFGRASDETAKVEGARGRVFFEDALLTAAPEPAVENAELRVVLGQPKPTTFQHYLVQRHPDVVNSMHWDGNYKGEGKALIRGHKLYFHRPNAPIRPGSGKEKVESRFRPAREGCVFAARIRFDQLRPWELGALLAALELPAGCAHHLGMGKPLGLGSFAVTTSQVMLIDYGQRYSMLGDLATGLLETGVSVATGDQRSAWRKEFAEWLSGPGVTIEKQWESPRWRELKALLTMEGLPPDWANRTRYLEFGKVAGRDYNEYKVVGYPGRVEMQQRRPLPPASQVLTDRRLPSDGRPPFEETNRD